jgi:menaquinone-dependent protoporphyrinogen oxidase
LPCIWGGKGGVSRRRFLKIGCLGAAACGGAAVISALAPDLPSVELKSFSFGVESMKKVLIAYASRTGTTLEIAEAVGRVLGDRGYAADVSPITDNPSLSGYQFVLIGSAIQGAGPLPEALDYLRANQAALREMPARLFLVHFFFRSGSESDAKMREKYLEKVRPLLPDIPVEFFAGRFDRRTSAAGLPDFLARFTPTIDRRDWGAIRAWVETAFPEEG